MHITLTVLYSAHLLGGLVKHFTLNRKSVRPLHEIVELLSALKDRFNCFMLSRREYIPATSTEVYQTHQNDFSFVQFLLHPHYSVRLTRILVLLKVGGNFGK